MLQFSGYPFPVETGVTQGKLPCLGPQMVQANILLPREPDGTMYLDAFNTGSLIDLIRLCLCHRNQ